MRRLCCAAVLFWLFKLCFAVSASTGASSGYVGSDLEDAHGVGMRRHHSKILSRYSRPAVEVPLVQVQELGAELEFAFEEL